MTDPVWSVRLNARTQRDYESGATGMSSESFAREVYENLCATVRNRGGRVELLRNGEVVVFLECLKGGSATD